MVREWGLPWIRLCLVCYRVLYSLTVRRWGVSLTENFMCFWRNKQPNTLHFPCMFMYICCYIRIDTIILHRYRFWPLDFFHAFDTQTALPTLPIQWVGPSDKQTHLRWMRHQRTDKAILGVGRERRETRMINWSLINQYNSHAQPFFFSHNISSILSRALFSRLKA